MTRKIKASRTSGPEAPSGSGVGPASSVGGAAPDAVYFGQEFDPGRPFDTGARHLRLEFIRGDERARRVQIIPFEEKSKVVDVSGAAEDAATALAMFVPPIEIGVEHRLPKGIVGHFVVNENVDHDFRGTPFTVKRCSKRAKNARAGVTRPWVRRAFAPEPPL